MDKFKLATSKITKWWDDEKQIDALKRLNLIDDNSIDLLSKAIALLDEVYKNEWDLQLEPVVWRRFDRSDKRTVLLRLYINCIIHFPEIEITNSRKESHTIHDLYVSFRLFNSDVIGNINIGHIRGLRTTFSYAEYQTHYSHSHLSGTDLKNPPTYGGFCTGSGVIDQVGLMFNSSEEFDENLFKMYLFEIKQFVSWESIEGGPYQYMSKVRVLGNNNNLYPLDSVDIGSYMTKIREKILYDNIDFESLDIEIDSKNQIYIIDNDTFDSFVLKTIENTSSYRYYCSKDNDGNIVRFENIEEIKLHIESISDEPFYFCGKPIRYNVDITLPSKEQEKLPHPIIKNICKSVIEYEFNKEQIKVNAFR